MAQRRAGVRVWFRFFDDRAREWVVYLARPGAAPDRLALNERGATFCDSREVYIDRDEPDDVRAETLLHELMHVAAADTALGDAAEETAIRAISPHLLPILVTRGLRWPEPPRDRRKKGTGCRTPGRTRTT